MGGRGPQEGEILCLVRSLVRSRSEAQAEDGADRAANEDGGDARRSCGAPTEKPRSGKRYSSGNKRDRECALEEVPMPLVARIHSGRDEDACHEGDRDRDGADDEPRRTMAASGLRFVGRNAHAG